MSISWPGGMSKKNKKSTRDKQYAFDLKREKEAQELRIKKMRKKDAKLKVKAKKGVKVGKKVKISSKMSKSTKAAVVQSMDIDK